MNYLHESAVAIYRRRLRRRSAFTLTCVIAMVLGTLWYAAAYVKLGGTPAHGSVASASCNRNASNRPLRPSDVTLNIYNTTAHAGLAASVARSLERQGFRVNAVDNDPLGQTILGTGVIRHGQNGAGSALLAAARLPGATIVQDNRMDSSVDLVLGTKFKSLRVPPKVPLAKLAMPTSDGITKPKAKPTGKPTPQPTTNCLSQAQPRGVS